MNKTVTLIILAGLMALNTAAQAQSRTPEAEKRRDAAARAQADSAPGGRPPGATAIIETLPTREGLAERRRFNSELLRAQHMARRDPAGALILFEKLYDENPGHLNLRLFMAQLYRETGRLDDSEQLFRGLVAEFPEADGYGEELIRTLLQAGKETEALALLESSFQLDPPQAKEYENAARLMQDSGRYDLAEGLYQRGLGALSPDDEEGRLLLLERLLDHYHLADRSEEILLLVATELPLIPSDRGQRRLIRSSERLVFEITRPGELIPLADSLVASPQGGRLSILMRSLYLNAGDPANFAQRVIEAEMDSLVRPQWLFAEGQRCLESDSGEPEARNRATRRILEAMLAEPAVNEDMATRGHYQLARIRLNEDAEDRLRGDTPGETEVATLQGILRDLRRQRPESVWASELLVAELSFLRDRLGRAEEADSLLRAWLVEPRRRSDAATNWALELQLGENYLVRGQFDAAREHFQSLLRGVEAPGMQDWSRFRLAQLQILAGENQAAQDSLAELAKADPGSVLANDALDLALLLAEAAGWPTPVRELLARALPLSFGVRQAEAARLLMSFATEFPEDDSTPALLYHAGLLFQNAFHGQEALSAWTLLADSHPEDFRAPQGLERAARMHLRLGRRQEAKRLVQRILAEHPESPLLPSLRDLQENLKDVIL